MVDAIEGLRSQILANAKPMLKPSAIQAEMNGGSESTLTSNCTGKLDIVVFGHPGEYIAAVMLGLKPAIEGPQANTAEAALRKLLIATSELLHSYIPKVPLHQRNIHGGGVYDEDMISSEVVEAQRKGSR